MGALPRFRLDLAIPGGPAICESVATFEGCWEGQQRGYSWPSLGAGGVTDCFPGLCWPPLALDIGDNSADRTLQGWRGRIWICVGPHNAGPPSSPRKWRPFRRSQPPQRTACYGGDLRKTPLRWASQEPTKVATVAQIAAPQGAASYSGDLRKTQLRWASQEPTKRATVAHFAATRDGEVSSDPHKTSLR